MRSRFMAGSRRMMSSGSDTSDDQGSFRIYGLAPGDYLISGTLRSQGMMMMTATAGTGSNEAEGFAPGYYPGTPNMAEAQRVIVKGGQEIAGSTLPYPPHVWYRVRGRVTTANGEPAASMMIMATFGPIHRT